MYRFTKKNMPEYLLIFDLIRFFFEEATFTLTKRRAYKLIHNNYEFLRHRSSQDGATYWLCSHCQTCKAKAYTKPFSSKEMVKTFGEHSHKPTVTKVSPIKPIITNVSTIETTKQMNKF